MRYERYKQLMEEARMPNSQPLLIALKRAVNETGTPLLEKIQSLQDELVELKKKLKEIPSLIEEFRELYNGDLSSGAVSLLLTELNRIAKSKFIQSDEGE